MLDPKYPPNFILVQFDRDGKEYLYQSPFTHAKGDLVLVNTWGHTNVARVVNSSTNRYAISNYEGPLNSIVGVGYLLRDLPEQTPQPTKQTFLQWFCSQIQ